MLNVVIYLFLSHMKGLNQMCLWLVRRSFPECIWCWGGSISVCVISKTYWPDGRLHGSITCHLPVIKSVSFSSVLRPRDTSLTCTRTSEMDTTSSPCWRCSPERHWWALGDLWPSDIRTSASAVPPPPPPSPLPPPPSPPSSPLAWFSVLTVFFSPPSSL